MFQQILAFIVIIFYITNPRTPDMLKKNKIHLIKFENLIGFVREEKRFMNLTASLPATRRELQELLTKGLFLDQDTFVWQEGNGKGFYHEDCLLFL